jgi:predicted nucleotidyltransferase
MSLDFTNRPELSSFALVVSALEGVAAPLECDYCVIGATARDLSLHYAYGIDITRATEDVDFSVMVRDWDAFTSLRAGLIGGGAFAERDGAVIHKLRHVGTKLPIDVVPFGGVERPDRTIAWPPEHAEVFDCFGLREALDTSALAILPGGTNVRVPSIPALAALKLTAWRDRKHTHPGRDAGDLFLYMRHYITCGNIERLGSDHGDILDDPEFDYEPAAARLLGRDIRAMLEPEAVQSLRGILAPETDLNGAQLLAAQSGLASPQAMRLIQALSAGLSESSQAKAP